MLSDFYFVSERLTYNRPFRNYRKRKQTPPQDNGWTLLFRASRMTCQGRLQQCPMSKTAIRLEGFLLDTIVVVKSEGQVAMTLYHILPEFGKAQPNTFKQMKPKGELLRWNCKWYNWHWWRFSNYISREYTLLIILSHFVNFAYDVLLTLKLILQPSIIFFFITINLKSMVGFFQFIRFCETRNHTKSIYRLSFKFHNK